VQPAISISHLCDDHRLFSVAPAGGKDDYSEMVGRSSNSGKNTLLIAGVMLVVGCAGVIHAGIHPLDLWHQRQMYLPATFDTTEPAFARVGEQRHILLFSKTNGYRNHAAIAEGKRGLEQIAADNSWFVYVTENGATFNPATLQQFDSIVFSNTSGPLFTAAQQQALEAFIDAGGGVHHLHNQRNNEAYRKRLAGQIRSVSLPQRVRI